MTQIFRHLLRSILNETQEELGQSFDAIADFMADEVAQLVKQSLVDDWDDHRWDAEICKSRDEVKSFAGLNGSHPDHRHILGAIQGALALGTRAITVTIT